MGSKSPVFRTCPSPTPYRHAWMVANLTSSSSAENRTDIRDLGVDVLSPRSIDLVKRMEDFDEATRVLSDSTLKVDEVGEDTKESEESEEQLSSPSETCSKTDLPRVGSEK